tara:strand:+ start:174 stop:329 length:156 start_codon:yes stop_codon:yes gene_type:complete
MVKNIEMRNNYWIKNREVIIVLWGVVLIAVLFLVAVEMAIEVLTVQSECGL